MKILFVYDGEYPWDIRVNKLCNYFLSKHHEVHMVCRNKSRKQRSEVYEGINLHRVFSLPEYCGGLNDIVTFPAFFSPIWLTDIFLQARRYSCELIVVRDLPMALAAIWVGKILRIPVVLDMAECYPEMLRCIWKFESFKYINLFVRNPKLADIVERLVIKSINAVMVMVEESKDRLVKTGTNPDKIFIVSNTPEIERFTTSADTKECNGLIKLLYVGLINRSRGIETCIRGVNRYIEKEGKDIQLNIAGTGKDLERLRKLTIELNMVNNVNFLGWVDNSKVPDLISQNDVCVVPHRKCSHWDNTIPNKLFDYMAASKPVLVSNVLPMKRIVSETKAGLVYTDYDVDDLVEKLMQLKDPKIREIYGNNGRNAIVNKYNWNNEQKEIDKMFHELQVLP